MRIAIVGTGIAGNVAAYKLRDGHEIAVFEANDYVGGHTHTVDVELGGRVWSIDTGFIVFNDWTYPNFVALLDELGIPSQPTSMSFGFTCERTGLEYNGTSIDTLFAQRRNLLRPSFYRMLAEILRFNREAPVHAIHRGTQTLGEYLEANGYSQAFRDHYLVPMAAAIWSAEPRAAAAMPIAFLVRFFSNHGMLSVDRRPEWRVIVGGSRRYVDALVAGHRDSMRLGARVKSIVRTSAGVELCTTETERERFDAVFLACHSDEALALLKDATALERAVLGAIRYRTSDVVLHWDESLLPARRRAWGSWNYRISKDDGDRAVVTYHMNRLQGLEAPVEFCVTLNDTASIDPAKILGRFSYSHPVFTHEALGAQRRHAEIDGVRNTFFCGAYWRNGFHEDGVVSALDAVRHFNERLGHGQLHLRRAS